jgi:outer membrane protein
VAITDVQNARSQYDSVLANEVTARNNLDNAVEALRQVTGNYYPELASLNVDGFKTNKPQTVNALLKEAENRNLSLLQARLSQDLAREQIRQAQDGHLPTLNLTASTGISNTTYNGSKTNDPTRYGDTDAGQNKIGLSFSLPLYQGGMVNSQVKQAQYNFVGASEQLESAHRSVVQTVVLPLITSTPLSAASTPTNRRWSLRKAPLMPWKPAIPWGRVPSSTSWMPPPPCTTPSSSSPAHVITT